MGGMGMPYQFPSQLGQDNGYNHGALPGPSSYAVRPIRDPSMWIPRTFENESSNDATESPAIAIPNSSSQRSQEHEDDESNGGARGVEGPGSGPGTGVSLLTKSLQMLSESPPGGSLDFYNGQYSAPNASAIVGPHVTLSQSLRERAIEFDPGRRPSIHQQFEQLEQQSQAPQEPVSSFTIQTQPEEFLPSSSLPAYRHPSALYDQDQLGQHPLTASGEDQWHAGIRTALADGFPRRVRKTSFDYTVGLENVQVDSRSQGRHQVNGRPMPPPPESALVRMIFSGNAV